MRMLILSSLIWIYAVCQFNCFHFGAFKSVNETKDQLWLRVCMGDSTCICLLLQNNGDEAPKRASPIVFQEWTDTRNFFYLSKKTLYIERQLYFTHVNEDIFCFVYIDIYHLSTIGKDWGILQRQTTVAIFQTFFQINFHAFFFR